MPVTNAAFYHFAPVPDPVALAGRLNARLPALGVKGTVILAAEGVNGFLAGTHEAIDGALEQLRQEEPFRELRAKVSPSTSIPFRRLSVKVKSEIVTFRQEVEPTAAPRVTPAELTRLLDENTDLVLLDTRNEYEFRLGRFRGAESLGLDKFVELPELAASRIESWRGKKVITYCTGGIRCEKAAPYLRSQGVDAYQLDGGILKHLEETGGRHWDGECFVFDERIAVGPDLNPTGASLCGHCQLPHAAGARQCEGCGTLLP